MREYVCIGSPDDVSDFRERWMVRAQGIARDLGLAFRVDYASDPFFGRVGQMKAVSQKQQSLKFELLVPLRSEEQPTACMSFNYHRDHFGTTWDIKDANGEPAHTGCVAFGMDRLAVAMFHTHGTDLAKWPAAVARNPRLLTDRRIGIRQCLAQKLRCREISEADLDAVADLLTRGFVGRSRDYWMAGLRRQAAREVPEGYPRFGYMLDSNGSPVGVLLLLYTRADRGRRAVDPVQPVELVCRAGVSRLRAAADQDRAAPQGSDLSQYQPGDLDLADHRGAGIFVLLQRIVLLDPGAVARRARHDRRDRVGRMRKRSKACPTPRSNF